MRCSQQHIVRATMNQTFFIPYAQGETGLFVARLFKAARRLISSIPAS